MRRTIVVLAAIALCGCAVERAARLYPENDAASAQRVIEARIIAQGGGHGLIEMSMPDGEIVKGEYAVVRDGTIGFGSVFGAVFGPGGSASGSGLSSNYSVRAASPGVASGFGSNGTRMSCEFYNDNMSGHGYGACRSSTGALYRLQY